MKTWNFFLRAISVFSLPRMRTLYHSSEISSHASISRTFSAAWEFCWKVPSHILISSQTFELREGASSNISPLVCAVCCSSPTLSSLSRFSSVHAPTQLWVCQWAFFSLREPSSLPLVKGKNMKTHFPIQNIRRRKSIHVLCWKCDRTKTRDFLIFRAVEFAYYDSLCRFFFSVLCANHEVLAFCVPLLRHARSHQGHVWSLPEKDEQWRRKRTGSCRLWGWRRVKRHFFSHTARMVWDFA